MFKHYIKVFIDTALWLDFKSALLYAKQANINLYIWKKEENNIGHLNLIGYHELTDNTNNARNEIHFLLTAGFTHFNLLSKSFVQENAKYSLKLI